MKSFALCAIAIATMSCGEVKQDPPVPPDVPVDPCANGQCECTAATENVDCGVHAYCNVTETRQTCECVAGYTSGVNGCVWTGVIKDPALMTATDWTPVNGALMNPSAVGDVDPGEASFLPSALCQLAHVKQTVTMPSLVKAEPLVLELSYKNAIDFSMNFDRVLTGVSFGGNWSPLRNFSDANFHSVRICLPEGAYAPRGTTGAGAPVTFAFGPYQQPDRCPNSSITSFAIDHVAIVAASAGECGSMPGQGVNFDAEGTGGWTFTSSAGATAGFAAGVGVGNSRAARLTLAKRCESASMETMIDVPAAGNPALELFLGATAGSSGSISVGGVISMPAFETIPTATTTRTTRICLPPALRGQVASLGFFLSASGTCAEVLGHQLFADNVRVIDDPTCNTGEGSANPGFEHTGQLLGASSQQDAAVSLALVRNTAGQAHGGSRFLALETYRRCSSAGYTLLPTVPAPSGAAGPALKFFANVGVNADATTSVGGRGLTALTLTEGAGYRPYTLCLSPLYAGRPQVVSFSHNGGSGTCDNTNYGTQFARIDDLVVTTDPTCPAQ